MKILLKTGSFFGVMFLSVGLVFGQNPVKPAAYKQTFSKKQYRKQLPAGFMAGLTGWPGVTNHSRFKASGRFVFHIDTAIVYSNYINPQRYIYTYDTAGNQVTSLTELTVNGKWEKQSQDSVIYDTVGKPVWVFSKIWENGGWSITSLLHNTYDSLHQLTAKVMKTWEGTRWLNNDSSHYVYGFNGNVVSEYHASWVDSVSSWKNDTYHLYAYDSLANLKYSLFEKWDDSVWMDIQLVTYRYDSAANLVLGLVQDRGDTSWVNFYQEKYTYDSARNRISYVGQMWNDSVWVNNQRYFYTYDGFRRLSESTGQNWVDSTGAWANYEKAQYTYDTYNGIESNLYQQWNDTAWADVSLAQYNYDTAGNAVSGNYYSWDTTSNNWIQIQDGLLEVYYDYSSSVSYFTGYQVSVQYNHPLSTGIKNNEAEISQYRCFPNPVSDITTFSITLPAKQQAKLIFYNLSGQRLATIFDGILDKGYHQFRWSVAQYPDGVYFVSFTINNNVKTIKLLKQN